MSKLRDWLLGEKDVTHGLARSWLLVRQVRESGGLETSPGTQKQRQVPCPTARMATRWSRRTAKSAKKRRQKAYKVRKYRLKAGLPVGGGR